MEEIKINPDRLAEKRTSLAQNRSYLAIERTFAAWIRTGFAITGAGFTLAEVLKTSTFSRLSTFMGLVLVIIGMATFIYAWFEYRKNYAFVQDLFQESNEPVQNFSTSYKLGSLLIFSLLFVSSLALVLLLV